MPLEGHLSGMGRVYKFIRQRPGKASLPIATHMPAIQTFFLNQHEQETTEEGQDDQKEQAGTIF